MLMETWASNDCSLKLRFYKFLLIGMAQPRRIISTLRGRTTFVGGQPTRFVRIAVSLQVFISMIVWVMAFYHHDCESFFLPI